MAQVPSGTRFIGIATSVDLVERKSSVLNEQTQPYTIEDIVLSVPVGPAGPQGVQGPAGPIGPVGPAGLNWQGSWVSGTSYVADDAVGYDGASWFCILATSGTTTPNLDTTHWALLASQGAQGIQGVQGPTGAQGPAGNPATQTLQQTVDLGNTVTSGSYETTLAAGSIAVSTIGYGSTSLTPDYVQLNNGTNYINLGLPNTLTANRSIKFPDAAGTIALLSDVTLQNAFDGGRTMTTDNFTIGVFDAASGLSVKNTSSSDEIVVETTKVTFTKNSFGLKTTNLRQAVTPTANRTIYLPDADGTIALQNYKSYVALISQSGTNDPTATVVFNDTGATFTWNYDDVGSYFVACSSPILLSGKTVVFVTTQGNPGNGQNKIFGGARANDSSVTLNTSSNGILDLNLEIRIYA